MGLFNREKPLENTVPATATVLRARIIEPESDGASDAYSTMDEVTRAFSLGRQHYRLHLRVESEASEPFEVDDDFKVPRKVESKGLIGMNRLRPGLKLPAWVDPTQPGRVEVDWEAFRNDPGRKAAMEAAEQAAIQETLRRRAEREMKEKHGE